MYSHVTKNLLSSYLEVYLLKLMVWNTYLQHMAMGNAAVCIRDYPRFKIIGDLYNFFEG